jgi:hypothetical protein
MDIILPAGLGSTYGSNRNKYQEYFYIVSNESLKTLFV